jgi:uncharacterized protein (TIGR03437 family)
MTRKFHRKQSRICWCLAVTAFSVCSPAQSTVSLTRIGTSVKDAVFSVDGRMYTGSTAFSWPTGSKHSLAIPAWQFAAGQTQTRYTFQRWSSPVGPLGATGGTVIVTADSAVAWYNADLSTEYALTLNFFQCPSSPCTAPGTIYVNGIGYTEDAAIWMPAAASVLMEAVPHHGFVFAGWSQNVALPVMYSFILRSAKTVYPRFSLARTILFSTLPEGLVVFADQTPLSTPASLDWAWNSEHTLGALTPQSDKNGRVWVFRSWNDGGPPQHAFSVIPGNDPVAVTATFSRGVAIGLLTDPPGLNLSIDGQGASSPRYAVWAPGERHVVEAPNRQTDTGGAPWVFSGWSNNGAASQTVAVEDSQVETGIRLTAKYEAAGRVRVETVPLGIELTVDGAPCQAPCEIERASGTSVRLTAPLSVARGDGARLDLASWEGYAGTSFVMASGYRKITARYTYSYRLNIGIDSPGAAAWQVQPLSPDGYYPAGTLVSIGISPSSDWQFRNWDGDLSGSVNPALIQMDGPHSVRATLAQTRPPESTLEILNAAGDTPMKAVAAGSIASLFGTGLADSTGTAETDPLPQTLAGVTLQCAGNMLPLLYVSPGQINFQVPAALAPATYRLEVHRDGVPVRTVNVELTRAAPGLFLVTHADGSAVTPEEPARSGETVRLYATGLGPLEPPVLDGFQARQTPSSTVVDPIEVLLDGQPIAHTRGFAAPGIVGVVQVDAQLPDDSAPTRALLEIESGKARSNAISLILAGH